MNQNIDLSSIKNDELKGSMLSPVQQSRLLRRVRNKNNKDRWYVDWDMERCLLEVYQQSPHLVSELLKADHDKSLTKQFLDVSATEENLIHFAGTDKPDARWNVNVRVAHALLCRQLHLRQLKAITLNSADDLRKIWSNEKASAGAIGHGSKLDNLDDCFNMAVKIKTRIHDGIEYSKIWVPNMMGHRAQFSGEVKDGCYYPEGIKRKDRLIWMSDGGSVTVEGQHAKPVIHHCMTHWYNYAGGDAPDVLREKVKRAWHNGLKSWCSLDFSKFDQTIPAWLISLCFSTIRKFYDKSEWREIGWEEENFIHSRIILPGGDVKVVDKGIPSGSNYTQVVGSMCNFIMVVSYLASTVGGSFQDKFSYVQRELRDPDGRDDCLTLFCMGDDDLFFTWSKVDVEALSGYVGHVFGVKIHPEKTVCGKVDPPHFLKRDWSEFGEYREPLDMMIGLTHPEHDRKYEDYSPWHILYGMYLTYSESFPSWVNERFFISKMESCGGVQLLQSLRPKDLPGPWRPISYKARAMLVSRANRLITKRVS